MIKFHRLYKYILAFILLLTLTAVFTVDKVIKPIDLAFYKAYFLRSNLVENYKDEFLNNGVDRVNEQIKNRIIFIDIPTAKWPKGEKLKILRKHEADLLKTIDSMVVNMPDDDKPVIILDITFKKDPVGLDTVQDAMYPLIEKNVKIYASYKIPDNQEMKYNDHDENQAISMYDDYFTSGRLNTEFYNYEKVNGLVSYYSFEVLGDTIIKSLPVQVAIDNNSNLEPIDEIYQKIYPLPLKLPIDSMSIKENYYIFTNDSNYTAKNNFSKLKDSINLIDKFIIIGTPEDQQKVGKEGNEFKVPGPYIVATALIDQLNGNKFTKQSYGNWIVQLVSLFFFAFFVCLFFAVIYKYIKKLQTRPALIAIISWILGVLFLISIGYVLLEWVIIQPTFPILSMLFATILTWHFTRQFLVLGIMEGSGEFDVFISYSHSKSDWVKKHLLEPLEEIKKPDGSGLKIFFDEKSIGLGAHFTTNYMRSIIDSKYFIPVMSEDYYGKDHCRNEMDIAVKRNVEKLMEMIILALDYKFVPEEFNHINYIEVKPGVDYMSRIKKELIKIESETIADEIKVVEIKNMTEMPTSESTIESNTDSTVDVGMQEKTIDNSKQNQLESISIIKDSNEKDMIEDKKKKGKSAKKDKKKTKKEAKKEAKKEEKKKDKKKSDKKVKDKKSKKVSDKKNKKTEKKKSKKGADKKAKKEKKGKKKKS